MPEREVVVTRHAVAKLQQRRPCTYGELDVAMVAKVIRREARAAIAEGRISNRKPVAFRLHGQNKAKPLPADQRFVWSARFELGWIIAREDHADVVITSLTPAFAAE